MKSIYLILSVALTFAVSNVFAQSNPKFKPGTPYAKVKQELIKAGWKPVPQKGECGLVCTSLREKGLKEVEDCADSGVMPCVFIYMDAQGKKAGVITQGEDFAFKAYR